MTLHFAAAARLAAATLAALLVVAARAAPPTAMAAAPMPSLAPIVKRVAPAVVSIGARGTVQDQRRNPAWNDPFFRKFFDAPPDDRPVEHEFKSGGSGVIVDANNGYIVTNYHVIENATEITVTLADDRTLPAKVLGTDEGSDIAVLKVAPAALVAMALGDSSKLEVGDYVVAIGNPFGLQHTVTAGIVSALGRTGINPDEDGYEDFIQTDASINPGNSGGALVNLRGELIGINAEILTGSGSGSSIGIGFAIPVNMVKDVMGQLIQFGKVRRGVLGVNLRRVTPELARQMTLQTGGALVEGVQPGSAAERAGIKAGDIIVTLNGVNMRDSGQLRNAIGLLHVGDQVQVGLLRDGKPRNVTAAIAARNDLQAARAAAEINRGLDGAELVDAPDASGVIVKSVQEGSNVSQTGIHINDVIVGVGRTPVTDLKSLREAAKDAVVLVLKVRRGAATVLVAIR